MTASPYETVMGFIMGPWPAQAVRSAVDLSLAEHLADGPRTAAEIAEAEGADPETTARFLRACASMGLVAYAEKGFAGTDVLAVLHRDTPMSLRAWAAAVDRGLDDRFTAVAGDFFKEVPPGDILLLKFILHDWSDHDCLRILSNCRDALQPGGRVVITEIVIDDHGPGIAPLMDIAMLVTSGSRERTLAEFDDLLIRSGLRRAAATPVSPPYFVIQATAAA